MRLTYDEALACWARYGGGRPVRYGPGRYQYRYEETGR